MWRLAQNNGMLYTKRFAKALLSLILIFACICSVSTYATNAEQREVYLGGFPAGFVLNTTTVEVVGLCDVLTESGVESPARLCGIRSGDIIDKINEREINSSAQLSEALNAQYKSYTITITRDGCTQEMDISPVIDKATLQKRIGVLVKDSVNGIGTVTYVDKSNNTFGSLGHPVTDNSKNVIEINGGSIYTCAVYDVKRGVRGNPGELKGAIDNSSMIGKASKNCECGIFGEVSSEIDYSNLIKVQVGDIKEAQPGKAKIFSTLKGVRPQQYDVSIIKIDEYNKDNRNFVIRIDDEKLIDMSGGIVQGMSGSPIIQNGKLIGAVTHVFVNDPTRGYGISIDKMLNSY